MGRRTSVSMRWVEHPEEGDLSPTSPSPKRSRPRGIDGHQATANAVFIAGWHLRDALDGEARVHPQGAHTWKYYRWYLQFGWITSVGIGLLLVLPFITQPITWVHTSPQYSPSWELPMLSPWAEVASQAVVTAAVGLGLGLKLAYQRQAFFAIWHNLIYTVGVAALLIDPVVYRLSGFRTVALAGTILVAVWNGQLRRELEMIRRICPALAQLAALVGVFIGFCGWIATLLFGDMDDQFRDWVHSTFQLIVLITTSNFPDIMLREYHAWRPSCFAFIIFLLVGFMFLMSLAMAVVYSTYTRRQAKQIKKEEKITVRGLKAAFCILQSAPAPESPPAEEGYVDRRNMAPTQAVLDLLAEHTGHCTFLDKLGLRADGYMEFAEFAALVAVTKANLNLEHSIPTGPLAEYVSTPEFNHHIDIALLVGLALSVYSTFFQMVGNTPGHVPAAIQGVDDYHQLIWPNIIFALFFVAEAALKIHVFSLKGYLSSGLDRWDLICNIGTLFITIRAHTTNHTRQWLHFAVVLRSLRVCRIMRKWEIFDLTFQAAKVILPRVLALTYLLLWLLFFFSWIGNSLFGGLINHDPQLPQAALLAKSEYGTTGYYDNNFNDYPSSFVILFELLIVNNWMVLSEGFEVVTGYWSETYFVLFWWCGVVIVLNVVVSAVLDAFLLQFDPPDTDDAGLFDLLAPSDKTATQLLECVTNGEMPIADYGSCMPLRASGEQAWITTVADLVSRESTLNHGHKVNEMDPLMPLSVATGSMSYPDTQVRAKNANLPRL